MKSYEERVKMITDAAAQFPEAFGLRGFPGDVFRISKGASYVNDSGAVTLYTQRLVRPGGWLDFAKGTPGELLAEVTPLS